MMTDDPFGIEEAKKALVADANESDMIARIVEINEELESIGATELEEERENVRSTLKASMMKNMKDYAIDEVTGYYAKLQVRTKTVYNLALLYKTLGATKTQRYVIETVDEDAIKRGLKNGDLSATKLEGSGAMAKMPTSVALYIKKPGGEDDDNERE